MSTHNKWNSTYKEKWGRSPQKSIDIKLASWQTEKSDRFSALELKMRLNVFQVFDNKLVTKNVDSFGVVKMCF